MMKPSSHTDTMLLVIFFWFLFCFFSFITSSFSFAVNTSTHLCSYDQTHALLDFKNKFTINSDASMNRDLSDYDLRNMPPPGECSPSSHPKTNSWQEGQDCCYWDGVTCDITTGQVIGLDLSCSWLQGQLSSNSSLFILQHLQILNLAFNDFTSSEIPSMMSQFQRLRSLNLSSSYFYGEVPIEISYLSNLVSLDLTAFVLGELTLERLTMKSLVQNLTMLKELYLAGVDSSLVEPDSLRNISSSLTSLVLCGLYGIFPTSIFNLPNLQLLYLFSTQTLSTNLEVTLPTSNESTTLTDLRFSYVYFENRLLSSIGNLKSLKFLSINFCGITRSIPKSISNLTNLEYLSLGGNNLVGTIPIFLAYLTRLQYLDLQANYLEGSIPNFSNLSRLHFILLGGNSLSGTIPLSLYSLPLLRFLYLSQNNLTVSHLQPFQSRVVEDIYLGGCGLQGPIPSSLFTLPSLVSLDLSYNQLVGRIPEFKSTSLKYIVLSNNKLRGNIPSSIFDLANLQYFYFSSNNLNGTIDTSMLSKLQSLTELIGSNNNLSFTTNVNLNYSLPNLQSFLFTSNNLRDFPVFLRGSNVLSELDLSNNKIYGLVPDWLWDVGRDTLSYLNLAHNNLTGIDKLPWTELQYLDLRSNLLQGPLQLPASTRLVTYIVSNNSLTGDVPILICNIGSMEVFDLSRNNFSGTIPECLGNMSNLRVLDLSMNKFYGKILNFVGHEYRSLRTLKLNGNQLEGKLPLSLVNCENLELLDIGNNNINDTFPHWLRFIEELQVLVLKSNNFHGYIHDYEYEDSFQNSFQKLRIFDISNNNFVGSLPAKYIKHLETMKNDMLVGTEDSMYMKSYDHYLYGGGSYYHDSISLTVKGSYIVFEKIPTTFTTIDFSKNKFSGEILQVFGTLISLKSLNLSHNNLFGHIPSSIKNLRNLESLDLSSNKLDGTIPTELASLTSLGVLNLSQNVLVGPIPHGSQFDTFDNSSYEGNSALCGPPLSNKCELETTTPLLHEEHDSDDDDFDKKIILYGYVSGLVIGLSIGYIVLSSELPICLAKIVQRYRLRKLQGRTQLPRGRN